MHGPAIYITALVVCLLAGPALALDWDRLWLNDDQRAAGKMVREDYAEAARTFDDERWRAAAWYRAGDYERAVGTWAEMDDTQAHYNRGNALARAGRLEAAIGAYETVLERDPGHADARYNLEVIRERMRDSGESGSNRQERRDGGDGSRRDGRQEGEQSRPGRDSGRSGNDSSGRPGAREDGSRPAASRGRDRQAAGRPEAAPGSGEPEERAPGGEPAMSDTGAPEEQAAMEQWLRRVPDDPGGLLRRKFLYQYRGRQRGDEEMDEPW